MNRERLQAIAAQVLGGRKLHEIDFGEPKLNLEEKLCRIDQAIRQFPNAGMEEPNGRATWSGPEH